MPIPPLVGIAGPAAVGTAKHAAMTVAWYLDAATVGSLCSASLVAVLLRLAWRRLPDWIKEDVPIRSLRQRKDDNKDKISNKNNGDDEIERISSVIEKLQALAVTGSKKLQDKEVPYLNAGILAYIQLTAQFQKLHPEVRDDMYRQSGPTVTRKDVEGLLESLDQATWAYYIDQEDILTEHLEEAGYVLLHANVPTRPGTVGHYMAVSSKRKEILIGMKGTSSLEDLLTDCCGKAVPFHGHDKHNADTRIEVRAKLDNQISVMDDGDVIEVSSSEEMIFIHQGDRDHHDAHDHHDDHIVTCHQGILIAAQRVANAVQRTLENFFAGSTNAGGVDDGGYRLKLVGHSLGAGCAALLATVLQSRIPVLLLEDKLSVVAFAPPPVLGHDAAAAAASYCVSVVNNADIIPRSSLANLAVFLEVLKNITRRLEEMGIAPNGLQSTSLFFKKLLEGTSGELLMTIEEANYIMMAAQEKVMLRDRDYLYIPGRVLLFHDPWGEAAGNNEQVEGDTEPKNDKGRNINTDNPDEQFSATASNNKDNKKENDDSHFMPPLHCTVADGTTAVLRCFEFDGYRMLGDHVTASYYDSIETLLSKLGDVNEMTEKSSKILCK